MIYGSFKSDELVSRKDFLDLRNDMKLWQIVVRNNRSNLKNESDKYNFVIGPQAKDGKKLLKNGNMPPKPHSPNQDQLVLKKPKGVNIFNTKLLGVILFKK